MLFSHRGHFSFSFWWFHTTVSLQIECFVKAKPLFFKNRSRTLGSFLHSKVLKHGIFEWAEATSGELGFLSHFRDLPPLPNFWNCRPHRLAKETQCKLSLSCKGGNKYETPNDFSTLGAVKSGPVLTLKIKTNSQRQIFFHAVAAYCGVCRAFPT